MFVQPADIESFQRNGFIFRENFLAAEEFAQLKQELLSTPLETRETLQGDTVTRRMALDGKTLKHMPVTKQFLHSDEWRNLLNYVASFKVQPISYLQVIFSHVRKAKADPQTNLHSDTFHSSAKAWLFLEDVAEDEGPFVYVPGSHQLNPERLNWEQQKSESITAKTDAMTRRGSFRVSESEVLELGYVKPQAFAVKANTLVIADTYGFHARAKSLKPSVRIELWAYARRNPFVPWLGGDPLSLPFLKSNLVPLYWAGLDFLERKFQRNNPWKKVGHKRATDSAVLTSK
ncbi:phytanoyl-CoA dioxygenase family protein [Acinetobacter sp. BY484]|nr:phytanoyl-CoA dioxygenase family protein [Acinetobacter sp. BY484]